MDQKPSVGRIVHYVARGSADGEFPSVCRAAIVTDVPELVGQTSNDNGYVVHLCVLNPEGMFFNKNVYRSERISGDLPMVGGTWHWPERV